MKKSKRFILLLTAVYGLMIQVEATPIFASQYKMRCNACHSMMPTLNKTGLQFLRNGFRFSKDDRTLASVFLDANSSEDRVSPVHGLAGINIDSNNRDDVEKLNLYFGGSVTDTLSVYAITRSTYNKDIDNDLFGESNSRAFIQWNLKGNEHVIKLGWIDPLTMFSNTDRTLMDNALMGSGLLKKLPPIKKKPDWAVLKPLPEAPGVNATAEEIANYNMAIMPKQLYVLPVPYTGVGLVKGLEYSYLYNNKIMFLINYGIPTSSLVATNDDTELTLGIQFKDISGYDFGLVYIHQELGNIQSDSYIIPIEKDFLNDALNFQTSFVYKDSEQFENPYYGSQTTFTYQIDGETQIRAIASFDYDESEEFNSGYSFTYSKSWSDRYLIHVTGARHKGQVFDESIAKLSAYIFF